MIKHILFDLDGTLLPMDQEEFIRYYFPLLAKRFAKYGVDKDTFTKAIWAGMGAMVGNDGSRSNADAFWDVFGKLTGVEREKVEPETLDFYENEFNEAIASTKPTPVSDKLVKALKKDGIKLYLATNPVFPRCATMNRIKWAGLDAEDFEEITTYETNCYCKPNVKYYEEILKRNNLKPEECVMVGNDAGDDLAIRALGVKTYLAVDCLENPKNLPIETEGQGKLEEFYEWYLAQK